jgi:acyl carrier protein phosphodiesterase
MNWVAHVFLSQNDFPIQLGNLLADVLKPVELKSFGPDIYRGVECHYAIDRFTDSHKIFQESKSLFFPIYRHYSAVLIDIFYDHFLVVNWDKYCDIPYLDYFEQFHNRLRNHSTPLNERAQYFIDSILTTNRLARYGTLAGVENSLERISQRPGFTGRINIVASMKELELHYDELNQHFQAFFPQLIKHTKDALAKD